jgi:TRAP-type C4-dicarboxylate transport system permease small subunit
MARLSELYGRLLTALALAACLLLFLMILMICADVLLRNVVLFPNLRGLEWSNEFSENMLYLITMLTAPWILRNGGHIRVDILLVAIPKRLAWYCEWLVDVLALVCCAGIAAYGCSAVLSSYRAGAVTIKTLATPEWWSLVPLPIAFALLFVEIVFRMWRLANGERAPRQEAVSAG